jgi:UDP-2-acetamido-2,6-beta-L-arabino-hexul-4-ose reductase
MRKEGITGQAGFMGTHLYNYLNYAAEDIQLIPFADNYFDAPEKLRDFVSQCDTIVHLAAMNRHGNPQVIYDTNIRLVKELINACEETGSAPHIIFSSSTQEKNDNPYGKSKLEGRKLLEEWAYQNNAKFTAFIIPNVFGPFGNPYYNSFIATFSHQLTHDEQPEIHVDSSVKLIYIGELVEIFLKAIRGKLHEKAEKNSEPSNIMRYNVPYTKEITVSETLRLLTEYKNVYFLNGVIPDLSNSFEKNLFNTFVCYIDHEKFFPFRLTKHTDDRGDFTEIIRLNSGGQISFSTTKPGITRGNHFHTRKAERFAVIKGKAEIRLRKIGTNKVMTFLLDGDSPSFVDMPVWYTHNITNVGSDDLYTLFWINEHYDSKDPDTFYEEV